ncbi:DUF3310 domain-containing protein [Mammaliicoccus sciuri]|uniref:DUF3310 domain-containing protein n=1 Tax=Mammaliicoccus sciuri TaxID=1296 RepID=UPI000D1F1643|nr:DUF3310 domain-containing protein [Mammaliicoccus sciuri]PTJ54208.1 hypothetical protein BU012_01010 [Mammaliicoccus sciuri]
MAKFTYEQAKDIYDFTTEYNGDEYITVADTPRKGDLLYYRRHGIVEPYNGEGLSTTGQNDFRFTMVKRTSVKNESSRLDLALALGYPDLYGNDETVYNSRFKGDKTAASLGITASSLDFTSMEVASRYIEDATEDIVNNPSHYNSGNIETIDLIKEVVSGYDDSFVAHCVGTATKYVSRAPFKHDDNTIDLKKAVAYLNFAIKHLEDDNNE